MGQAPAVDHGVADLTLDTGQDVYRTACVSCHGADGRGASRNSVTFDTRLPDFTDCSFATKEPDGDWSATIHNGGLARGFSTIMPAFRDALTDEQIDNVIAYMRGFCTERAWPAGDLNFPRALITEKAFPESEVVITSSFNASRTSGIGNTLIIEKRIGPSGQIEVALPYCVHQGRPGVGVGARIRRCVDRLQADAVPQQREGLDLQRRRRVHRADRRSGQGHGRRDAGV